MNDIDLEKGGESLQLDGVVPEFGACACFSTDTLNHRELVNGSISPMNIIMLVSSLQYSKVYSVTYFRPYTQV